MSTALAVEESLPPKAEEPRFSVDSLIRRGRAEGEQRAKEHIARRRERVNEPKQG